MATKADPAKGMAEGAIAEEGSSSDYDATEHMMNADEVARKYGVQVDKEKPGKSQGLSSSEVRNATKLCMSCC